MVFFNYSTMQMAAKVVYYGPGLAGKTTNLQYIYGHTPADSRGEMVSLETDADRTLFFDVLPADVGSIAGFKTRLQLYTIPGQVAYNTSRKLVLKGVDGLVFVADSMRSRLQANLDSLRNLEANLEEMGLAIDSLPLVFQFNKRDLRDLRTVAELNAALNRNNRPFFEASAATGTGVFETLKEISKQTLMALKKRMSAPAETKPVGPMRSTLEDSKATSTEALTQPSPQPVPPKASGAASRGSRDYAGEIESLTQTFLQRKRASPAESPTSKAAKEEPGEAPSSLPARRAEGGIFICYRRSDSIDVAGRIHDRLVTRYDRDRVFKDVDSIPLGVDFRKHLENAVSQASIVLVVIGRSWLKGEGAVGKKSVNPLSDPRDFVRIEIELALRLNLPIIPVLVTGASMPLAKNLPESLADLAYRNGMELRPDPNFHKDMDRLITGMDALLKATTA